MTGYESVLFHPEGGATAFAGEFIDRWGLVHQWRSGGYASNDYDFQRPKADLTAQRQANVRHKKGDLEVFDYPAGFITQPDVESYVSQRLDAFQSDVEVANGAGDVRGLGTGNLFTLADFPNGPDNKQYLIVSSTYDSKNNERHSGGQQVDGYFHYSFAAIDSQVPYRPARSTPAPRVEGVQTAVVVGERRGDHDRPVRPREGAVPLGSRGAERRGQLLLDPRGAALGRRRVGRHPHPAHRAGGDRRLSRRRSRPADHHRAGLQRRQHAPLHAPREQDAERDQEPEQLGGRASNFNELRFEDKKGSELVNLQAEKDLTSLIKHDEDRNVGNDRTTEIAHDETITVGNNRTETVSKQESITIGGDRQESVGKSETVTIGTTRALTVGTNETIQVGGQRSDSVAKDETSTVGGNQSLSVGKNQSIDVGGGLTLSVGKDEGVSVGGNLSVSVGKGESRDIGKKLAITAGDQITLTSGSASITLKSNGDITINGANITLKGSGKITVQASSDVIIKGSKVSQN